jgi:hypothetical protein
MKTPKILWGLHPAHGEQWLKLCDYSRAEAKTRKAEGWKLQALPVGVAPIVPPPKPKTPATPAQRKLKAKLEALKASPGTPDEGKAAAAKLARLLARADFTLPDVSKDEIFAGSFERSTTALPVMACDDWQLAASVKWAIETATGCGCIFQGSQLLAHATPRTATKLSGIADTIKDGFIGLWSKFRTFPTITPQDKAIFYRGLYDGMMNEAREGILPARQAPKQSKRGKRAARPQETGFSLHPYTIAADLGRQIRFNVPLSEVINQLENQKPKEITA